MVLGRGDDRRGVPIEEQIVTCGERERAQTL